MATLKELLEQQRKQRDSQGTLTQVTQEQGLATPPITPGGATALGAKPDAAKMAGTPAQKQNALATAQTPPVEAQNASLADVLRRQGSAGQVGDQSKVKGAENAARSQALQTLGSAADRAQQLIQGELAKAATASAQTGLSAQDRLKDDTTLSTINWASTNLPQVKQALSKLATNPADSQALIELNRAAGRSATNPLTPAEIAQAFQGDAVQIGQAFSKALTDTLTVNDLLQSGGIGYDLLTLSNLLGVDQASLAAMTATQLRDQITAVQQREFTTTGVPLSSQAEQGLAAQQVAAQSTTGTAAANQQMAALASRIGNLGTVTFMGKQMPIEDLLKDENISRTISDMVLQDPNSSTFSEFATANPQLAQFINTNREALRKSAEQLQKSTTNLNQTTATNLGLRNIVDAQGKTVASLNDDFMKAVYGDQWNQLSAQGLDANQSNVLKFINSIGDVGAKATVANNLNSLASNYPEVVQEVSKLGPDAIAFLGLDKPLGTQGTQVQSWIDGINFRKELTKVPAGNINELMRVVFGTGNATDAQAALDNNRVNKVFGGPTLSDDVLNVIDADRDGRIDPFDNIRNRALQLQGDSGLASFANQNARKTGAVQGYEQLALDGSANAAVVSRLQGAIADGRVTPEEVKQAGFTYEELMNPAVEASLGKLLNADELKSMKNSVISRRITDIYNSANHQAVVELPGRYSEQKANELLRTGDEMLEITKNLTDDKEKNRLVDLANGYKQTVERIKKDANSKRNHPNFHDNIARASKLPAGSPEQLNAINLAKAYAPKGYENDPYYLDQINKIQESYDSVDIPRRKREEEERQKQAFIQNRNEIKDANPAIRVASGLVNSDRKTLAGKILDTAAKDIKKGVSKLNPFKW
jgi:hypothetical protein